jgi:hypothetical protein
VCPSDEVAERGANASPGAVLADRNANGETGRSEDGLLRVDKHTAKPATAGDMHVGQALHSMASSST